MADVLKLITLVFCVVQLNSAENVTEIEQFVKTSVGYFYWNKYFRFPFVMHSVAKFIEEADAVIQIREGIYTGNVDKGLTMALRPYRQKINKVLAALEGTGASQCAGYYKLTDVNVYSAGASTGYDVIQVPLYNTSRTITNAYVKQYSACARGVTDNLRTRISTLNTLLDNLTRISNGGEDIIRACGVTSSLEKAEKCVMNYSEYILNVGRQFLEALDSDPEDTQNKDEIRLDLKLYDKELFSIPNCLLNSYVDAIGSANNVLRQIQQCANASGVEVSINQTSVTEYTQNLQTVMNFLETYYNLSRLDLEKELEFLTPIHYLFYEIDQAERAYTQNTTVESVLNANVKAKSALKISAESTNITLKICVYQAFKLIRADIATQINSFRTCALASLNYALSQQRYANATHSRIFDPLKPSPVSQIAGCITRNILNTTTLEQCTSEIHNRLENEFNIISSAFDTAVAERNRNKANDTTHKFVDTCNSTVPSLKAVYQCDETLFSFLAV